jgi:hypothetical protein
MTVDQCEADERATKAEIAIALIETQSDGANVHTGNRIAFWLRCLATLDLEGLIEHAPEKFDALYAAVIAALPHWESACKDVEVVLDSLLGRGGK